MRINKRVTVLVLAVLVMSLLFSGTALAQEGQKGF